MMDLVPATTRVFLFHSYNAAADPSTAMNAVNEWLARDRSAGKYPNVIVKNISITSDGQGGVFTLVTVDLGVAAEGA